MNHYIISNYLKASKTFDIYRDVFKHYSLSHYYNPVEISTFQRSAVSNQELSQLKLFLDKFRNDKSDQSIVVSNPFKQVIVQFCDTLSPEAEMMRAVNMIYKKNGKIFGRNIDGQAFYLGQKKLIKYDFAKNNVFILGCGGVSTAVSFTLAELGVSKLTLFDIDKSRSKHLMLMLKKNYPKLEIDLGVSANIFTGYDVIYNGTGIGKQSNDKKSIFESPISDESIIPAQAIAIDANYTPWETEFLRICKTSGCSILNGFSHMIGFTTMHLSEVLGKSINFNTVKKIGERYVNL